MPQADASPNTHRRILLGRLAAIPALGAINALTSAASAATGSDLPLIAACQKASAIYDQVDAIGATGDDDAALVLDQQRWALCDQIAEMRATTAPGAQAMARLIIKMDGRVWDGDPIYDLKIVKALLESIVAQGAA